MIELRDCSEARVACCSEARVVRYSVLKTALHLSYGTMQPFHHHHIELNEPVSCSHNPNLGIDLGWPIPLENIRELDKLLEQGQLEQTR